MYLMLILLGVLFFLYFICIAFFVGHGTNFYFIWSFLGVGTILFAILWKKGLFAEYIPMGLRRLFLISVLVGGLLFALVEGCIISGFSAKGKEGLDYLVVLGAQMKANGPSKALQYRLDEAVLYLEQNEETMVIVSGGQGKDEHISEAQGMYDYLIQKGIAYDRIIMEDRSENTYQNLTYSGGFLDKEKDTVGVVTSNFHVFRAVRIAKKAGYENVWGIAARGEPFLQYNNMMREFFGVVKDFLVGNM